MTAILFVVTLVALVIVATCVLGYASHCFLLVTQETAAGNDEVVWPDEPMYDWVWKVFYLAWLVGVWLFPVMLILGLLKLPAPRGLPGVWFLVVATVVLWLMFPLSLFSSLSAQSPWVVFRPSLLPRLARRVGTLVPFYAASAVLLAYGAALVYASLNPRVAVYLRWSPPILITAPMGAAVLLIYARLLGRFAWQLGTVQMPQREPPPKKKKRRAARMVQASDPWEPPPRDETAIRTPEGIVEAYGLTTDPEPLRTPVRVEEEASRPIITPEGEVHGYDLDDEEPARPPPAEKPEEWLQKRVERLPPPEMPLVSGVYSFPWYATSVQAWLKLSGGFFVVGALARTLIALWPF